MSDALAGAGQHERARGRQLAGIAAQVSAAPLQQTTVATAQAVLRAVAAQDGRGALGEPAADLRRIRTDPALADALAADLDLAERSALVLVGDALWSGYLDGLAVRGRSMGLRATATDQDREDLAGYPIHGLTASEVARSLRLALDESVQRALAAPLLGATDPASLPSALSVAGQAHAARVASAVDEAFHCGVQAAVRAIGAVLTGAA